MQPFGVNELRKMFLEFFESKDHLKMKSFSLVPHNDNSLLIINSGMAPLKPYFTGQEIPPRKRVTTCQKCVRTGDIENVGKTARHLTFFEMLGNFSFGDYFKQDAIKWSWEFLTEVIGMDPERLYPSIYCEDDEAYEIWTKEVGVPGEKITRFYRDENGDCDNFWEHGAGPCGPCSEIYYDRGIKYGCGKPDCKVGCDCDRFMEVWNNVFTQFDGDGHGNYTELAQKNIDTGMGLERLAVVVQDVDSVFDIDTMKAIRDRICGLAGVTYQTDEAKDVSIRLITDHMRSSTFMISDGIMPSNEGRGYVLRRLIRRAARHGRKLGIEGEFLANLSATVIAECKDGYPELEEKKEFIFNVLTQEENKFNKTIDQGLSILEEMEEAMTKEGKKQLSGAEAFKLYDTYGFPLDLTMEILEEKGFSVDEEGFSAAMEEQKETARKARKVTNYMGADVTVYESIDPSITTEFVGYDRLKYVSKISVLTTESELTDALTDGQTGTVIVEETPFYATMGGQCADTGKIVTETGEFVVEDTVKLLGGKVGHIGKMTKGMLKVGDSVTLEVDADRRADTCKNHSATHLLQKALRTVLGTHVEQAGSYVDGERLRFDFSHFSAMTKEELLRVEQLVNEKIVENIYKIKRIGLDFTVRMTITQNTIPHMYENICYLHENGFNNIAMIMDIYLSLTDTLMEQFANEINKITDYYIQEYNKGTKIVIDQFDGKLLNFLCDFGNCFSMCDAGITNFKIMPTGDIYPCGFLTNNNQFVIGNIRNGVNIEKSKKIAGSLFDQSNDKCEDCKIRDFCHGMKCGYANYIYTGKINIPSDAKCYCEQKFYESLIKIVNYYLSQSKEQLNHALGQYISYIRENGLQLSEYGMKVESRLKNS